MEEFKLALQYFTLLGSSTLEITSNIEDNDSNNDNIGEYKGDILQYPELLWTEDKWDEYRLKEAEERIKNQNQIVSNYWRERYENKSKIYWHEFYKRNSDHFYKDRHYLHIVFPELSPTSSTSSTSTSSSSLSPISLLEVGCGVGNAVLPLIELLPNLTVYAIDIAPSAIEILKSNPLVNSTKRLYPDVCNIVTDEIPSNISDNGIDLVLCMFVLSAISPKFYESVLLKLVQKLRNGGKILFRDYGRYDEAQLRFGKNSKIDENFYVRQDGTCSYFFSVEDIHTLANKCGLEVEECYYIQRQYANRRQQQARYRVWLHAKLIKKF